VLVCCHPLLFCLHLTVSCFVLSRPPWLWVVDVGLSGYCLGQYPSMHPPLSCHRGQLILSPHMCMPPTHHLWSDICPPNTCPSPENSYCRHYSLVCVSVGMVGKCPRWWFLGDMCLGRGKCPAHVTYKCHYDFISIRFIAEQCCLTENHNCSHTLHKRTSQASLPSV